MIVPSHTVTLIRQGKVTCLILPAEDGRKYRVGESYAVQSWKPREQGGAPVVSGEKLRVKVTQKWLHLLAGTAERDAEAAGHESLEHFFGWWREKYKTGPLVEEVVATVVFELDHVARGRFLRSGGGYTTSPSFAMGAATDRVSRNEPPEPECVTEQEQRDLTKGARAQWSKAENVLMRRQIRERDQRRREQGVRLEDAKRKLRLQGKDFSSKERAAERVIRDLERLADEDSDQEAA